MKRINVAVLALLLGIVVLPPRGIRAEDAPKAENEWPVAPLLPPETLAVVTVPQAAKLTEKFKQTALWRIYSNPDIQKAFQLPLAGKQMALAAVELQAGVKLNDILSDLNQGEVTFAFIGADQTGQNGEPIPDLLLNIQARGRTQAVLDELSRRVDQVNAAAGNQLQITETAIGNYTIHRVGVPNLPIAASYAVCDGNIIVTFGDGIIEKVVALHEKQKAGQLKADAKPAEALLQTPAYASIARKAGLDNDFTLFVNWEALRKNERLNVKPKNDQEKAGWAFLGLESIRSFAYTFGIDAAGEGIREVFIVDAPAAQRSGLLTLLPSNDGVPFTALARAPRSAVAAVALKAQPDKMLDRFEELVALANPGARAQIDQAIAAAGQGAKIDVRKDLFGALTGEAVVYASLTNKNPKLGVSFPQVVLSLSVKNADALKNTLTALRASALDKFDYFELDANGRMIVTAREKFAEGRDPKQLAYTLDDKELLVSLYPLALREELRRRDAARKDPNAAQSLTDDADFKSIASSISGAPELFVYADTAALATALYESLIPAAQLKPRDAQVDVLALPPAADLVQNLGGAVFGLSCDDDGIVASGTSPGGIVALMSILLPAAGAKARENSGRADAIQHNRGIMDEVAQSLQAYAKDNNGAYPQALRDMQPKYLADFTRELDSVVFRGKQDKPNKVVAHTSEKLPGPITIVLQDGTVADIRRELLGKVLNNGYTADSGAQAGKARKGDADF